MQIAIEISEEIYDHVKTRLMPKDRNEFVDRMIIAIAEGTPLPEHCEDCVSREAIKELLFNNYETTESTSQGSITKHGAEIYIEDLNALPPVTPKHRTGKWIKTPKAVMGEGYLWYCDKCGHQVYQDTSRPYPSERYCPNCGAKMEGESEE